MCVCVFFLVLVVVGKGRNAFNVEFMFEFVAQVAMQVNTDSERDVTKRHMRFGNPMSVGVSFFGEGV